MRESKTKICASCEEEKDIDDFQSHYRSADGRMNICRVCHSRTCAEGMEKARERVSKKSGNGKGDDPGKRISLDLESYPEVVDGLEKAAHREIRSVEHQAIAFIVRGLQKDGTAKSDATEG